MVDVIKLDARHYVLPGRTPASTMGLAVDAAVKELVLPLGAIISDRYAPHDYQLDGVYHEIKSSNRGSLSIPNSEIEFAELEVAAGRDVIYDVVLQFDVHSAKFLGSVPYSAFKHLVRPSQFFNWRLYPNGWVQERGSFAVLREVKPLLT